MKAAHMTAVNNSATRRDSDLIRSFVTENSEDAHTDAYDREMNFVGKLPEHISHFDLAVDVDGQDVAVGVSKPGKKYDGSVIKLRLKAIQE